MPGPTALVDLATLKTHLQIGSTTSYDAELSRFIARATPIIETLAGPVIQRTVTAEQHNNVNGRTLALIERPIVSITTCTEYIGRVTYAVTTAATPDQTGTYGATLDPDRGVLTRWAVGTPRNWAQTVWVTYVAGRSAVPDNVEQATLELIRHMWETQRGDSTGRPVPGFDQGGVVIAGYAVPNRVVEMLGEQERIDGFA